MKFVFMSLLLLIATTARSEDGVTPDKILIGQSTALTGDSASRVLSLVNGYKLFIEKTNKAGGVNGRKIDLIIYDDAYDPKKAFENTKKLIDEDKVFVLFKYFGTPTIKAAIPKMNESGIPMIASSSGARFLRNPPIKNVFVTRGGFDFEGESGTKYIVNKLKIKDVGVFYQDDGYGDEGKGVSATVLNKLGLKPAVVVSYQRNTVDVDKAFDEIMKVKPKAIFGWGVTKPTVALINKIMATPDYRPVIFSYSTVLCQEFLDALKGKNLKVYMTVTAPPIIAPLEVAKLYSADAKAAGQTPDDGGLEGYIDGFILVKALELSGKDPTRKGLINAMETKMKDIKFGGLKISYGPTDHQGLDTGYILDLSNGDRKLVETISQR